MLMFSTLFTLVLMSVAAVDLMSLSVLTCRRLDRFNNTNGVIVGKTNVIIPSVFTMIFFSVDFYGDLHQTRKNHRNGEKASV